MLQVQSSLPPSWDPAYGHQLLESKRDHIITVEEVDSDDETEVTTAHFEAITSEFLRQLGFRRPTVKQECPFYEEVVQHLMSIHLPTALHVRIRSIAKMACWGIATVYPFLKQANLRDVSIFTTYFFIIDDLAKDILPDLRTFTTSLMLCHKPSHPVLRGLIEFLPAMKAHYGQYIVDMFYKCTIDFINGCILEEQIGVDTKLPIGATSFPRYFRLKTGYGEPYALFAFPEYLCPEQMAMTTYLPCVPDLTEFVDNANDILSFYKESVLADERFTCVQNYARTNNTTPHIALQEITELTVRNVQRMRATLRSQPEISQRIEELIQGCLECYVTLPRYRINELKVF